MPRDNNVIMEGVRIIFRNFRGEEGPYNKKGERNFAVLLDEKVAADMAEDGWNVKILEPREDAEEGEERQPFLPVALRYDVFPPRVVLVTSNNRTVLDEAAVQQLDNVDILNVDIIVRPYSWSGADGKSGIKAYVKTMYVTIEEDPLDKKYAEMYRDRE